MKYGLLRKTILFFGIFALVLGSCSPQRENYMDRVRALEEGGDREETKEEITRLEKEIDSLVDEVEQITEGTRKLGTFYKMLAVDFFDASMFGPSLEYLDKAVKIYPQNHVLYYYAGVSSAKVAKTVGAAEERRRILTESEYYYLEALKIRPAYRDALYAIGVLYVFELNTPDRGIPYLKQLVELTENNHNARFVLAHAYAALGELNAAEKQYNSIIESAPESSAADSARRLLSELQGETE